MAPYKLTVLRRKIFSHSRYLSLSLWQRCVHLYCMNPFPLISPSTTYNNDSNLNSIRSLSIVICVMEDGNPTRRKSRVSHVKSSGIHSHMLTKTGNKLLHINGCINYTFKFSFQHGTTSNTWGEECRASHLQNWRFETWTWAQRT